MNNFETPGETTDFIAGKIASIVASNEHDELGISTKQLHKEFSPIHTSFSICINTL
jgi:hypothetical protein